MSEEKDWSRWVSIPWQALYICPLERQKKSFLEGKANWLAKKNVFLLQLANREEICAYSVGHIKLTSIVFAGLFWLWFES